MQKIESTLTVFFEGPFWVGVYKRISDKKMEACKITFGAEPKDYEVYEFLLQNWHKLRFSPPIDADSKRQAKINPKRMQRRIQKQLHTQRIETKSQQALKLQQEENKRIRKEKDRRQKEEEKQRKFELQQKKRKNKHKGR
jgi:hypothetical protein